MTWFHIKYTPKAKDLPLVGERVLLRGVVWMLASPIRKEGKKLLAGDGLPGLPSVMGSIVKF